MKSVDLIALVQAAEIYVQDDAKEVQVIDEYGNALTIQDIEYDPQADVIYVKCESE